MIEQDNADLACLSKNVVKVFQTSCQDWQDYIFLTALPRCVQDPHHILQVFNSQCMLPKYHASECIFTIDTMIIHDR